MGNVGVGLVWAVLGLVCYKVLIWAWPLIEALIGAGLALLGYALIGVMLLGALYTLGCIMRFILPSSKPKE